MHDPLLALSGLPARLVDATKDLVHAFLHPDTGVSLHPDVVVALLVFGVILVVSGTVQSTAGKKRSKFWWMMGIAAGVSLAGWVLFGGQDEVATFFVILLLVLKFLGGITFVLGLFRSIWVIVLVVAAIIAAAMGWVPVAPLGQAIGILASFLGAWSLFKKAEEFSPGRKGSRWNRRTAVGWVVCLLAAAVLEPSGLGKYGTQFKLAGMAVGVAVSLLLPKFFGRGGVKVRLKK
ncbi:MAG: hypothetical protein ACYTDX_01035 [Planctomycetota bacterium]|jgi:hypothetical protein